MYRHFVSLGWYCGTASSLAKYGGRSFSSPFDWGFFGLSGILHALECDFSDFLDEKNLVPRYVEADGLIHVVDKIYDMDFNHEIHSLEKYEEEMIAVREKYKRRIAKLLETMKKSSVCFVRCIRDANEISYIQNQAEYVSSVIKKNNAKNDIIFMIPQELDVPKDMPFKSFLLNRKCTSKSRDDLRGLFDVNVAILPFIRSNMNKGQRSRNLLRDLLYEEKIGTLRDKEKIIANFDKLYYASRGDVIDCFHYILGREPRGNKEIKACMKVGNSLEDLREYFLASQEFSKKVNTPQYICRAINDEKVTEEKVKKCYRYILGREAENEQVVKGHMKKFQGFSDLRSAFLTSEEFKRKYLGMF